jgi:hypothetical protein
VDPDINQVHERLFFISMDEIVKIVIPSHKRATRVRTSSVVANAAICVPKAQADLYKRCNPGIEVVQHPDDVIGLARKRDWIVKHFKNVFMLDDDIDGMRRLYSDREDATLVEPLLAYDIIQATALAAKEAGAFLYGFSHSPTPVSFNSLNPIKLTGYVTGCAHGVLEGSKLWYNPEIICNEDYWISLLNAYHHRMLYKDTRYYFDQKDTFVNAGGLAEFRNVDAERKDFELLHRTFGDAVYIGDKRRKSPKHQFQKTLKLPF